MFLSALRLTGFRNLAEQRLALPAAGVAIVGDNGQGKTNLLEAIYYLEIFRSFRGAPDEQLVRFGEGVFRVEGRVEDTGGPRVIAAAFDRRRRKKKVTLDGVETPRLGDAIGRLGVVLFSPADLAIVSGSPAQRRRFLDILLSLTEPGYLGELQRYRQILSQRNAVLRGAEAPAQVRAWDEGLIRAGTRITAVRARWVAARGATFAARVREIAGTGDVLLEYAPSAGRGLPAERLAESTNLAEVFAAELERGAERERRAGATLVGPHRDDLRLRTSAEGEAQRIELRHYGSGGQQRTAAVALRMVEADTLRDRLGSEPVILLDDVFAELDPGRSRRILEWVERERQAQVILTAPKRGDFELRGTPLPLWRIREGSVSAL